jgi:hypothetical protein
VIIFVRKIKLGRMRRAEYVACMKEITQIWPEIPKDGDHLEKVSVNRKIILKWMLKGVGCETVLLIRLNIGISSNPRRGTDYPDMCFVVFPEFLQANAERAL